jgi:hypothetical protein
MAEGERIVVYAVVCDGLGNYHTREQAEAVRKELLETPELFIRVEPWTVTGIQDECVNYADDDETVQENK